MYPAWKVVKSKIWYQSRRGS